MGDLAETTAAENRGDGLPGIFHRDAGSPASRQGGVPAGRGFAAGLLSVSAGAEGFTDIARFGLKKLVFCGGFFLSPTARRAMTIWATSSPRSIPHAFRELLHFLGRRADQDAARRDRHR